MHASTRGLKAKVDMMKRYDRIQNGTGMIEIIAFEDGYWVKANEALPEIERFKEAAKQQRRDFDTMMLSWGRSVQHAADNNKSMLGSAPEMLQGPIDEIINLHQELADTKEKSMSTIISKGTKSPRELEDQLRVSILSEIKRRNISVDELAKKMDMLDSGARTLLERGSWPLDLGVQIAHNLGIPVELRVGEY